MSLNLNIEILSRDEAEDYFKRQIDETHIAPYVDFLSKLELGEAFRVPIEKGTEAESARTLKRNFNAGAKLRKASSVVRDAADTDGKLEATPEGMYRSFVSNEDGSTKAVFRTLSEQLAPVLLRWKADTHNEKKDVTKDGKTTKVDVIIVDKLVGKLAATVVRTTTAATPEAEAEDEKNTTPAPGDDNKSPGASLEPLTDEQKAWAASLVPDQVNGLAEHAKDGADNAAEYNLYLRWKAEGGVPEDDTEKSTPPDETPTENPEETPSVPPTARGREPATSRR